MQPGYVPLQTQQITFNSFSRVPTVVDDYRTSNVTLFGYCGIVTVSSF